MSDRVTEQIRAVADCREILRAKLPGYKGRGNAKCLWHDDRQASLQVESDHAFCHSPGCEAHKRLDCFSIVMMIEGCTFPRPRLGWQIFITSAATAMERTGPSVGAMHVPLNHPKMQRMRANHSRAWTLR